MFNFYKSNKCISFGGDNKSIQFDAFDMMLSNGPGILLVMFVLPLLWINRRLEIAENMECTMETLKLMIARHNFLMIIVVSDLMFDCIFNLWIEFTHT